APWPALQAGTGESRERHSDPARASRRRSSERCGPGNRTTSARDLSRAPSPLTALDRPPPPSTALLVRFHFLRERTRHRTRHRLGRRWRRLEPLRRLDLDLVVPVDPRPRRDQVADDDVLLQPEQVVPGAPD